MPGNKRTHFNDLWLKDENYSLWVQKCSSSTSFHCKLCKKERQLGTMGEGALKVHAESNKHKQLVAELKSMRSFFPVDTSSTPSSSSTPSDSQSLDLSPSSSASESISTLQSSILESLQKGSTVEAEIRWVLFCTKHNFSDNSMRDFVRTIQSMLPDSALAKTLKLCPSKIKNVINYGLYPYFKELLLEEVLSSPYFVVSFDESLNHTTQSCQMDINVRYWDVKEFKVQERYWHSEFLGKSASLNLLESFQKSLEKLDVTKLIQIAMDGPHVNWLFLDTFIRKRKEDELNGLLVLGSCNLHIIHGAFMTGAKATTWNIKETLKGSFNLLHDTPARRADYTKLTGSKKFPMFFCGTRWVEDKEVADHLIDIWPHIVKFLTYCESLPASKRPTSKSYLNVKAAVSDNLTVAKLHVFSYLASLLKPTLVIYQSDQPMLPFLFQDLKLMLKTLLGIIVKPTVLEKATTAAKMLKIDLNDENNLLKIDDIHTGFAAEAELRKNQKQDTVTKKEISDLKGETRKMVSSLVAKLVERSPLNSVIVKNALVFNPNLIITYNPDNLISKLKVLIQNLVEVGILKFAVGDRALTQYQQFLSKDTKSSKEKFLAFDRHKERLDDFFFKTLKIKDAYEDLSVVLVIILILSTGQGSIERGFSTNKPLLKQNMKEDTVVARRLIKGHLTNKSVEPHSLTITSSMIKHYKAANMRYTMHLQELKEQNEVAEKDEEKQRVTNELKNISEQCCNLEKTIETLNQKFVKLAEKAEKKNDMKYIIEGNALKRKSDEKSEQLQVLKRRKDELRLEKQKLS